MRRLLPNALVLLALGAAPLVAQRQKPDTALGKILDRELKRPSRKSRADANTIVRDKLDPETVAIRKAAVAFTLNGGRRDGTVAVGPIEIQADTAWTTVDQRNQHVSLSRVRVERRGRKWVGVSYAPFAIQ